MRFTLYIAHLSIGLCLTLLVVPLTAQSQYIRGDGNADGAVNIADPSFIANFVFGIAPATAPTCRAAADANGDNTINIADPSYLANSLFGIAPATPPPHPYPGCGVNADDVLSCEVYEPCPPVVEPPVEGPKPETEIFESDNHLLAFRVRFPEPRFEDLPLGGENFSRLVIPGLSPDEAELASGVPGTPAIPIYHRIIAVPEGAQALVTVDGFNYDTFDEVYLYPQQPVRELPVEGEGAGGGVGPAPPVINHEAYKFTQLLPESPVQIQPLGKFRDLNLALLSVASAQYIPVARRLRVLTEVFVSVLFEGGEGAFVTRQSMNAFEFSNYDLSQVGDTLNGEAIFQYMRNNGGIQSPCEGEELIIITTPEFFDEVLDQDPIREFRVAKFGQGIVNQVYVVAPQEEGGIGTDANEIKSFIASHYYCEVRPSYVMIIGDVEHVPTHYRYDENREEYIGTDVPYSLVSGQDMIPDMGVARISVDTKDKAREILRRIIRYETNPEKSPAYYRSTALMGYFQCGAHPEGTTGSNNIRTLEAIGGALEVDGYSVLRQYRSDTDDLSGYTGDPTPRFYKDGVTPLPSHLGPNSGYPWSFPPVSINAAFDAASVVIHRGPGHKNNWRKPEFHVEDYDGSDTSLLISADGGFGGWDGNSGEFDTESKMALATDIDDISDVNVNSVQEPPGKFLESLMRKQDGLIGMLGASRKTHIWADDALTRGFADAIFPNVDAFGTATPTRRLADILLHGKLYMYSQVGLTLPGNIWFGEGPAHMQNLKWHAFGDPSQEVWVREPGQLSTQAELLEQTDKLMAFSYGEEGAWLTAIQNGSPLGRVQVKNGVAKLRFMRVPDDDSLIEISASRSGYVAAHVGSLLPLAKLPGPIQDESEFRPSATRLTFEFSEGVIGDEVIENQYAAQGVTFRNVSGSEPTIEDNFPVHHRSTRSGDQSLINLNPTFAGQGSSAGRRLTMDFSPPVRRVGMYVGNGGLLSNITASLSAYDVNGDLILRTDRNGILNDVLAFIGVDAGNAAGSRKIAFVELSYGAASEAEEIDDLLFEQ